MINMVWFAAMREVRALMLLNKLHPVLTYLYPDGTDTLRPRTLP